MSKLVSSNPSSPVRPTGPQRTAQKQIRQQERVLLDVWSTTGFMKVGGITRVILLPFRCSSGEYIRRPANKSRNVLAGDGDPVQAGAGIAFVMMLVFILIIGPPPSDGRCVLPWC